MLNAYLGVLSNTARFKYRCMPGENENYDYMHNTLCSSLRIGARNSVSNKFRQARSDNGYLARLID